MIINGIVRPVKNCRATIKLMSMIGIIWTISVFIQANRQAAVIPKYITPHKTSAVRSAMMVRIIANTEKKRTKTKDPKTTERPQRIGFNFVVCFIIVSLMLKFEISDFLSYVLQCRLAVSLFVYFI